jgi:hypothetical protein
MTKSKKYKFIDKKTIGEKKAFTSPLNLCPTFYYLPFFKGLIIWKAFQGKKCLKIHVDHHREMFTEFVLQFGLHEK